MASVSDAIEKFLSENGLTGLKTKQEEVLQMILNGEDCLAILPTGYGKSLPYQMYIPMKKAIDSDPHRTFRVIVCCPLLSLMEDQVSRITKFGVTAAFRGKDQDTDRLIEEGKFEVIFSSPESLADGWVQHITDVTLIVIDECHTIPVWGGLDDDEDKAFRKCFRYVGSLRSLFPDATVLALSATCTLKMKKQVLDIMNINTTHPVEISPNKQNIKLVVNRIPSDIESTFFWLIEKLNELEDKFPRILLYCNSIQDVSKLYSYICAETSSLSSDLVDMYHSETPSERKESIVTRLGMKSNLRIVVATSALGMGLDVYDCQCVVLYGPPKDIVGLLQASGRCGRDGEKSICFILCNRYQLSHVSGEVKDVIKCTDCRRMCILQNFTHEKCTGQNHLCCDLCASKCTCGSCTNHYMENFVVNTPRPNKEESDSDDSVLYEYESDNADVESDALE